MLWYEIESYGQMAAWKEYRLTIERICVFTTTVCKISGYHGAASYQAQSNCAKIVLIGPTSEALDVEEKKKKKKKN